MCIRDRFSLPPFGVSVFYYISFSIIYYNILTNNNFSKKYIFYFFLFTQIITLSWITQSFYSGGFGYLLLGIILVGILSIFIAFLHYSATILILVTFKKKLLQIFLLPLGLSIVEILKEFIFGGFPWNPSAIIYYKNIWILKSLPFLGVYGLGLVVHLIVGLMIYFLYCKNKVVTFSLSLVLVLIYAFGFFENNTERKTNKETLNILLIQPNLYESLVEFDVLRNLEIYEKLTLEALTNSPKVDLIIWPESSISSRFLINNKYNKNFSSHMTNFLKQDNINLVAGIEARYINERYNSSVLFKSDSIAYVYHKQRLVPNVEHTPKFFDILGYNLGADNFNIGKNLTMFNINGIDFASMVCLESIFPNPTRSFVNEGAKFLVYIVNDGWYIKPPEPQQHAKRCIYRAIENRRTVLRSANTGISMIVNPHGNITNLLELNKSGSINAQIEILDKITFYTKYGNLFSIFNVFFAQLSPHAVGRRRLPST